MENGRYVSCAFTVTVQQIFEEACDDNVPVNLDPNCSKTITLDMVLMIRIRIHQQLFGSKGFAHLVDFTTPATTLIM